MSLWKIAWRSIQQRALASTLTAISMALGITLVVAVLVIHGVIGESFRNNALGYNMIVGAKGGKLQLVFNTVYYLSSPVENIPYSYYKEFTEGRFKNYVQTAIPVCLGDYYENYRVIGTTPGMFNDLTYGKKKYEFAEGENFKQENFYDAVIGSRVAREHGLSVGAEFQPSHGAESGHKHDPFKIVGVLKPTGTPVDRGLFINMEGFFLLDNHAKPIEGTDADGESHEHAHTDGDEEHDHAHEHDHEHDHAHEDEGHDHEMKQGGATDDHDHADHEHADHDHGDHEHADEEHADHEHADAEHADHEHADHDHADHDHHDHGHDGHHHGHSHEPLPEAQREVTAILVKAADVQALGLVRTINKGQVAQAVLPILEVTSFFSALVDPLQMVLLVLTVLIVVVSGIGILISIYNSMSDRRHEIAVMRALGAGRRTVMLLVLFESILLALGGGFLGWLLGHGLLAALGPWINAQTGVQVGFLQFVAYESAIIPGLILLASLVGYLPALAAYRTDVAKAMSATP